MSFVDVDHAEAFRFTEGPSTGRHNPLVRLVGIVRKATRGQNRFGDQQLELTVETRTFKGARLACDHHQVEYLLVPADLEDGPLPDLDDIVDITGGLVRRDSYDSRGRSVPHHTIHAAGWQLVKRRSIVRGADADQRCSIVAFPPSPSSL